MTSPWGDDLLDGYGKLCYPDPKRIEDIQNENDGHPVVMVGDTAYVLTGRMTCTNSADHL